MSVPRTMAEGRALNARAADLLDVVRRGKSTAARIEPDAADQRYQQKARTRGHVGANAFDKLGGDRTV